MATDPVTLAERIGELVTLHGSLRKVAEAVELDVGYLSRLLAGDKARPSKAVLQRMGLRAVLVYYPLAPCPKDIEGHAGTFADKRGTFADPERMRAWEEAGKRIQAEDDGTAALALPKGHRGQDGEGKAVIALLEQARDFLETVHDGEYGYSECTRDELIEKIEASLGDCEGKGVPTSDPVQPDPSQVICPNCTHQFRAIPVDVQQLMLAAGFEPPFTAGVALPQEGQQK